LTGVEPIHAAFGNAIRELRHERNMSQEALALEANINRSYASGIERGVRNVSLTNIAKLAGALDVELSELFLLVEEIKQR
jgi:transcriptional regulator with XRE-family HTH domain